MAKNTLYHHTIVNILFIYGLTNGMDENSLSKLIVVYATFSALAFLVNFYLGFRVIYSNEKVLKIISTICLLIYSTCCIFNWSYQFYNLYWNSYYLSTYGYTGIGSFTILIIIIMYDDFILIKYLKNKSYFERYINSHNILKNTYT